MDRLWFSGYDSWIKTYPEKVGDDFGKEMMMEDKILSLYACGMSQRDIAEQIKSMYDVEISPELVSKISEKIGPAENFV